MSPREKQYDRRYFEKWYRRSSAGIGEREYVERKVRLAVAAAEFVLCRPVESVLDVGCGEAPWRAILRRLRPGVRYEGLDGSAYAVERYGRTRDIRLAREAGALVLLDDDFTSIASGVKLGRGIYDNARKAMAYIVAVHVPIVGMSLLPLFVTSWPVVLLPAQIAFLELIIDPACSVVCMIQLVLWLSMLMDVA